MAELIDTYDRSGQLVMTLQQFIDFEEYVRCICIGRDFVLPIQYDPRRRCYIENEKFLPKELEQRILDACWAINGALGYDMNSVEFAVKDGTPYAIDFTNPAPDMDIHSILPKHFHIAVDEMARFAMAAAKEGRRNDDGMAFRRFLAKPAARPAGELRPGGRGWFAGEAAPPAARKVS
jgi:hypothetical protein